MITINQDRCIECMTCVTVCPFTVIQEIDGGPQLAPGKNCIGCMHCSAVCPTEAILLHGKPAIFLEDIPKLGDDFAGDLKSHILRRRSYRHFSQEAVSRGVIEEALELASWAPSAKNQHTTRWIVIETKELIDQIMTQILEYVEDTGVSPEIASEFAAGNNVVMGTAPTLILAYAEDRSISPETDTAIAMTTAELYLQARGVGTCWAGYLKRMCNAVPQIRALLPEIPEGYSFYGAFMAGYPEQEAYIHIPERSRRAQIAWA